MRRVLFWPSRQPRAAAALARGGRRDPDLADLSDPGGVDLKHPAGAPDRDVPFTTDPFDEVSLANRP